MSHTLKSNRREFLKACVAGAALFGNAERFFSAPLGITPTEKSKVAIGKDPLLRGKGTSLDSGRLLKLLDRCIQTVYDSDSPQQAWKRAVRPGEVVGLKVNGLAGRGISTNVALVELVCERVREAGVPAKDIIVWDRLDSDLESAGFRVTSSADHVRFMGNDSTGYEDDLSIYGSVGSRLAKTLTQACDAVINLPVLKDHGISGVSMALKNFLGAIHNPNKYHLNVGDPYIADVNMLPPIRQKVRLHICDATTAQYEGGPSYMPQWSWQENGLLMSRDPVALDYVGWKIIERKRAEKGMKPLKELKRDPTYISTAADSQHRLGTNDPARIDQVEV